MKKLLAFALVAITTFSLHAQTVEWEFTNFPDNCEISYRVDSQEKWDTITGNGIVSFDLNGRNEHTLTYRTSMTGGSVFTSKWIPDMRNEFTFSISPYALNLFSSSKGRVLSDYAFQAGIEYQHRFIKTYGLGAEFRYSFSKLEAEKGYYGSLRSGAVGSIRIGLGDEFFIPLSISTGADTVFYADSPAAFFYMAATAGYGWQPDDRYSVITSLRCDMTVITGGTLGWQFSPDIRAVCHF
ncbi:MAG: hypothetical protein ACI4NM_11495 [Bullifex sp.]